MNMHLDLVRGRIVGLRVSGHQEAFLAPRSPGTSSFRAQNSEVVFILIFKFETLKETLKSIQHQRRTIKKEKEKKKKKHLDNIEEQQVLRHGTLRHEARTAMCVPAPAAP